MGICSAVYFRLCVDLMHILPQVTAGEFDGSHHPRYAECPVPMNTHLNIVKQQSLDFLKLKEFAYKISDVVKIEESY